MDDLKSIFSFKLKLLMQEKNISQVDLGKILDVDSTTVGKWLLKKSLPRMGVIQKLSDCYNIDKSYFITSDVNYDNILSYKEQYLLTTFRTLDNENQDFLLSFAEKLQNINSKMY